MPWNMAGELGMPVSVRFDDTLASVALLKCCGVCFISKSKS